MSKKEKTNDEKITDIINNLDDIYRQVKVMSTADYFELDEQDISAALRCLAKAIENVRNDTIKLQEILGLINV